MKKIAKLSLVASLAIAASAANAQDLSEAIKNVDVSGTVAYRYNDYDTTEKKSDGAKNQNTENNYKIALNASVKANDDVKVNTRFLVQSFGMDTATGGDANVGVKLSEVNFAYTGINNATITVGKQGVDTAFTVARDSIGTEATGTGIVATYAMGPVSVFAAYFNQNNFNTTKLDSSAGNPYAADRLSDNGDGQNDTGLDFDGSEDIIAAGVNATFGAVNVDASYLTVESHNETAKSPELDAYTVGLSAAYNISDVKLSSYARYSALELDNAASDSDENSLWKVGVKANVGMFGAYVAYGETDEEGGVVGLDASSTTGFDEHWRVTLSGTSDASVVYAAVDAQVTDKLNLALKYSDLDAGSESNGHDQNEIYGQAAYKMSKNFFTYARFGVLDHDNLDDDVTIGRIHVQYSF